MPAVKVLMPIFQWECSRLAGTFPCDTVNRYLYLYQPGMSLTLYNIVPALQPYVKAICSLEIDASAPPSHFRVLPDTCVELFISYTTEQLATVKGKNLFDSAGSLVNCRLNTYMDVQMFPGTGCIALCFQPGAAHYFFNLPMSELTNMTTGLDDLWGREARELQEQVGGCTVNRARVHMLQQYLLRRLEKDYEAAHEFEYCLWQINLLKGSLKIKDLSQKTNISQRQLSRQFNDRLGMSPKEFARISRFIDALSIIKKQPTESLTQVACASGYYDQSHFIHDCREFAGLSPKELMTAGYVIC